MRVKRLEIQGFKSFKDKTVIHFDHGITGIVGPNGCGKSNIVDAFFWVMGEQSYKHMRGASSDDLIFNGSSRHSALGMAEATMVLETDAPDTENAPAGATAADVPLHLRSKEVSVTRRLYRDGSGEYFINGLTARLKDIQELFMDTGVGAKGYSVIEQGQIGKIVNSKPEERRLLIEEAAGIAKYKARKKESIRKMEATQANLARLTDIIQEIEKNLSSLERQAQKARQYKKYKDELFDKEMTWGRRKAQVISQRLEALRKQKDALEQELVGLKAELQTAENSIETDRVAQVTLTKAAEELQAKIQQLSDELTRERSALELSKRRQTDLASQRQSLESERTDLQTSIEAETAKSVEREEQAAESGTLLEEAQAKAADADQQVRSARQTSEQARRALESTRRELMAGVTATSDLTNRDASLASRIESARTQAERLEQQAQSQGEKVEALRIESEKARTAAEEARSRREALVTSKKESQANVQQLEQKLRQAERDRDQSLRELAQIKSRLQSLEELAMAHEGLAEGPKAALDWAAGGGSRGKLLALADAFDVAEGREAALEGWLEGRLESLVALEADVGLQAIDEVTRGKSGRIAVHVAPAKAAARTGDFTKVATALEQSGFEVLGALNDFVKIAKGAESSAAAIAASLVEGVCVVRTIASAGEFLEKQGLAALQGWSIVSEDGVSLGSDGILRGGSQEADHNASLIRRKQVIQQLQEQVTAKEASHQKLDDATQEARESLEQARERYQDAQTELQQLEVQSAALERDVHQMSRALREAEEQIELTKLEVQEMTASAEKAQAERQTIEGRLAEIAAQRGDLEAKITEMESSLPERDDALRALEDDLQQVRIEEASLRERTNSLRREWEAGKLLISDRQRRLNEIDRILEKASREQQQFTGGEGELETKIEDLTKTVSLAREELGTVKGHLEDATAKVSGALDLIKELHKHGDQRTTETNGLALEVEKLSGELSHLTQNLEEKYGPGCLERPVTSPIQEEMNEPVITTEMSAEEELLLGEEVERLRERIRRLGEVNPLAVEEYEESKKRFDYLVSERQDLERSIENLQEAIEHINKTSEERFRKAFDAIADRFQRLFPIIFGGGQARLSLVYPEGSTDILEAGCDILAQPPGKKVSNIGLLSGGEKALTAVSLIFAIFMVKPSPFCVLDEVDAPLDDANIGKFNALLREMSAKSQFILITHNKKTMELNDTLYGVTMEEPGVSKMVSIELQ